MPPNLGGFFMVRSYYPSECHADYFDFERIEALKPAIEACGISTLSQSPMLGFHKQMDNRIKLLEEILSFRMQGVEFDNGDLFLLVLILLLMPTLNFLPVWFALSLLRFRLPSRLPMMFILWMVAMMVVIIPSRTV